MTGRKNAFDLASCARPNILSLTPYRCARDDYKDDGANILLDANENAYGPCLDVGSTAALFESHLSNGDGGARQSGPSAAAAAAAAAHSELSKLNRYPDPHQAELKQALCALRNTHHHTNCTLQPENLFVGVGSDEAIDAVLRCFCVPGKDKILTCPPTYGMYTVSAHINNLAIVQVPLDTTDFQLRPATINEALTHDPCVKVVFACSPGNPTGQLLRKHDIQAILEHPNWNGVVVVDEAYIDFAAEGASLAEWVTEWPNLIVMQTLSKAFGLAGIRLGAAFASPQVAQLLNNLKAPYNLSSPTSVLARAALQPPALARMRAHRERIVLQRQRMLQELPRIPGVGKFLGGVDANFLLVQVLSSPQGEGGAAAVPSNEVALAVYEQLAELRGVVVRFRGKEHGCEGALRITVGTEAEVDRLLERLGLVLASVYEQRKTQDGTSLSNKSAGKTNATTQQQQQQQEQQQEMEEVREDRANEVIA